MTATTLYRAFDSSGQLLYVGISGHTATRFSQHRAEKSWWSDVAEIKTERFPNRLDAALAERDAIRYEAPRHNKRTGMDSCPDPMPNPDEPLAARAMAAIARCDADIAEAKAAGERGTDARHLAIAELAEAVGPTDASRRLGVALSTVGKSRDLAKRIRRAMPPARATAGEATP